MSTVFESVASSPALGLTLAHGLRLLNLGTPVTDLRTFFAAQKPNNFSAQVIEFGIQFPRVALLRWSDLAIVLCQGLQTPQQAVEFVNGFNDSIDQSTIFGLNSYIAAWMNAFSTERTALRIGSALSQVYTGHSAGGCLAVGLLGQGVLAGNPGTAKVVSFGAPRPGYASLERFLRNERIARWMHVQDVVPNIPPLPTQAPATYALLSDATAKKWIGQMQPLGGIAVDDQGATAMASVTASDYQGLQTSIAAWFWSTWENAIGPHSIESYVGALRQASINSPRPLSMTSTDRPDDHRPKSITAADLNRIRVSVDADYAVATRNIAEQIFRVPPAELMRHEQIGRSWVVTWQGRVFAVAPHRARARDMARAGNVFLKRLQRSAIVSLDSLKQDLDDYLVKATNPDGSFLPPMRIGE